ncbi:MAG: hypothetical protein ACYC26_16695 [Phycisphaerales bacterium]
MTPCDIVKDFYLHLASAVGVALQHGYRRNGYVWPVQMIGDTCVYHHVLVIPYVGDFERVPLRYCSAYERPIPRIKVNQFTSAPNPTRKQVEQRFVGAKPSRFKQHSAKLELSVTMEQLVDFAPWLAAWIAARTTNTQSLLATPPHPIERGWDSDVLNAHYLWSQAAADEYEAAPATKAMKKRHEQERQQRAQGAPVGGTVAHGATGQSGGTTLPRAVLRDTGQRGPKRP